MNFKRLSLLFSILLMNFNSVASENGLGYTVRAMLEPAREAMISSELTAKVATTNVRNGDRFHQGDTLIQFDCSIYQAGYAEAAAELGAAKVQLQNKQTLLKLSSVGEMEVRLAEFDVDRMQARLDSARTLKEYCTIQAPFNGRVIELAVNEHESVETGEELIWLLDDSSLEVNLVLPSEWLTWLENGTRFQLTVDETGLQYSGHIMQLGARVDAVSQSIRVTGKLDKNHKALMAGMSGTVLFDKENRSE